MLSRETSGSLAVGSVLSGAGVTGYSALEEGVGTDVSMPGFSICMRNVTPMPRTSTAAIDTGPAQRFPGRERTARREAARMASSSAGAGSSRPSSR